MSFFIWLENSAPSMWIKEAGFGWPYDIFLSAHAIGMAFVVGVSSGIALRVLGYAPKVPIASMKGFLPFVYGGFWLNALSGLALALAYPTKAVSNPVFYLKMAGVAASLVCFRALARIIFNPGRPLETGPLPDRTRFLGGTLLALWAITISAGRLLAYHDMNTEIERETPFAVLLVLLVIVVAAYGSRRVTNGQAAESRN